MHRTAVVVLAILAMGGCKAKSDATKACELGLSEACARAKQIP